MLAFLSSRAFLISAVSVAVISVLFYVYFLYAQSQIATLSSELGKAQQDIKIQKETIDQIQALAASQKAAIESMQGQISQAETERAKLADAIRSLNITTNAFVNRQGLQQNLNTQLNSLFQGLGGPKPDAKKAP